MSSSEAWVMAATASRNARAPRSSPRQPYRRLRELEQYPICGRRMNKRHHRSPCSRTRRLVDHTNTRVFEPCEHLIELVDSQGDVMQTRSTLLQEATNG